MEEILIRTGMSEEKEVFLNNLERACNLVYAELLGDGRKR
jgi:hypothetical protein